MNANVPAAVASVVLGAGVLYYLHAHGYGPMFNLGVAGAALVLTFHALRCAWRKGGAR